MISKRILITGGSGFIGTHLVRAAREIGHVVTNLDNRPPVLHEDRAIWTECDLLTAKQVDRALQRSAPEVIYNLAAIADISLDETAMRANTEGLDNLIRGALKLREYPHLVHASTQLVIRPGYTATHALDFAPYTEYGKTKAESERRLRREADDLTWTIVRPTTVWGPWHATFADSIWKYLNRRWYMLPTNADPIRSYGYVGNVVQQLLKIADVARARSDRAIFYLGDPPMQSSAWLDGFARALTGQPCRRVPSSLLWLLAEGGEVARRIGCPAPIDRGRLFRMTTDYPVPMSETLRILGAGPTGLDAGIEDTVGWLRRRNPKEFEK